MEEDGGHRLLDALPDPVIVIDGTGTIRYANDAAADAFDGGPGDLIDVGVFDLIHPDDLDMVLLSMETVIGKDVGTPLQLRIRTSRGWRHFEVRGRAGRLDDGQIVIVARDTTERRRYEVAGTDPERLAAILHSADVVLFTCDTAGVIGDVTASVARIGGWDPDELQGRNFTDLVAAADRDRVAETLAAGAEHARFAAEVVSARGQTIPFEFTLVDLTSDPVVGAVVVVAHDISELRDAQRDLEHLATHDPLTGLSNRSVVVERIETAIRGSRGDDRVAVLFIDLDRFKPINDLHGHDVGDDVLVEVARRLKASVRPTDTVARIGGDEFVVIAEHCEDRMVVGALAERLENAVSAPYDIDGTTVVVYASVGAAVHEDGTDAESLLADADGAMYAVKARRRGVANWTAEPVSRRRALAAELAEALTTGDDIVVHYQPILRLTDATTLADTIGFEALVRWLHPTEGLLAPGAFLAVAEEAGLAGELGRVVCDKAFGQLADWARAGYPDLMMAVNLSATELLDGSGIAAVRSALEQHGVEPGNVTVEITEHTLLERHAAGSDRSVVDAVEELAALGVKVAIDDFGTGYSSLTHVRTLGVHGLKADRSFVAGLDDGGADRDIVAAVVALGHAMGMTVVAEGVCSAAQLVELAAMGCDYVQGFGFSPAITAEEATAILAERHSRAIVSAMDFALQR